MGSICDVSVSAVQWALSSGHVPVLQGVGETAEEGGGRIVVLDVGEVTARLAAALQPRKVLFINTHGGFVDQRGEVSNIKAKCSSSIHMGGFVDRRGEVSNVKAKFSSSIHM